MTSGVPVNVDSAQQLTIMASGDPTGDNIGESITVCASAIYDPGPGASTKMINTHLQGSGLIYVDYDSNDALKVFVFVTLPNGVDRTIEGGYLHLKYHGKLIEY
jgi:hypothetical protein